MTHVAKGIKRQLVHVAGTIQLGEPFTYSSGKTPEYYDCSGCCAKNCKLWYNPQRVTAAFYTICANCAAEETRRSIKSMDATGRRRTRTGSRTYTIGWYVPAIPREDSTGFVSYLRASDSAFNWWRSLPNHTSQQSS